MPDPIPESNIKASVLNAALQTPAKVLTALYVMAPAKIITGDGYVNLSLSQTSETLKSGWEASGILISFETFPAGIIMSCNVQTS